MHKTIEMVKDSDGVYREGKTEPKQAVLRSSRPRASTFPKKRRSRTLVEKVAQELNDTLEEIGIQALNQLTRGFFR